jgi:hypothetical protein
MTLFFPDDEDFLAEETDFVGDGGALDESSDVGPHAAGKLRLSSVERSASGSSPPSDRRADRSSVESRVSRRDSDVLSCRCAEECAVWSVWRREE